MVLQWHQSLEGGLETGGLAINNAGVLGSMDLRGCHRGNLGSQLRYVLGFKSFWLL